MPRTVYHRETLVVTFRDKHKETWTVDVEIDVEAIAFLMGDKAIRNKTGKSSKLAGYIKVKRVTKLS